MTVDTLGQFLAATATLTSTQERTQVAALTAEVQPVTGGTVEPAFVDQGYTGAAVATDAATHGIQRETVRLPEVRRGFILLRPKQWRWAGAWPVTSRP